MKYQYPDFSDFQLLYLNLSEYARMKCEQGSEKEANQIIEEVREYIKNAMERIQAVPDDPKLTAEEPDDLPSILRLRENGPRTIWKKLPGDEILADKIEGALTGRMIGNMLGVPVEGHTVENMEAFCEYTGKQFPPVDYWENVMFPHVKNFYGAYGYQYIKHNMRSVPIDDDVIYTQLALLIMEECGCSFTTEDVGKMWRKYLPFACTAEEIAVNNLKKDIPIDKVGITDNPYRQWIGAAIRSDGFAYAAAGMPEKAADMAYHDAFLSHRRNGIYGEMFLAAVQSAAFTVHSPIEAVKIGLTEIPKNCSLHKDIEWALEAGKNVKDHKDARKLVDERFGTMHIVHTNNNLCLIVFGLMIGEKDIVKGLSETVAMGLDSDCTAASAGSVFGAIIGKKKIPEYLYKRFNNTIDTYIIGKESFHFDDMTQRFMKLAKGLYRS